jgi:ATP-dependent RNA helicase DDX24/MAK5
MCLHAAETAAKTEPENAAVPRRGGSKKNGANVNQKEDMIDAGSTPVATKRPPPVSIAPIVGGMSTQKQRRVLDRGVDILVATPGRLWDILEDVGVTILP